MINTFNPFGTDSEFETVETCVCTGPNTFGHKVLDIIENLQQPFATRIPTHRHRDVDLGADPVAATQLATMAGGDWHDSAADALTDARDGAIAVSSLGGSGFLAHSLADCPEKVIRPVVNVVVGSFRLRPTNDGPQPVDAVTTALSYPYIDRGTILLSNRAETDGYGEIPDKVARLIMTLIHQDVADLETGVYSAFYEPVPIGHDQFNVGTLLSQAVQNGDPWLDPEDFLWWEDAEEVPPFDETSATEVFALLPPEYDRAAVQSMNSLIQTAYTADLEQAHIVVLRSLSERWVNELQQGPDWLEAQLNTNPNPFASRWKGLVEKHGLGDDPIEALDDFRDRYHP